MSASMLLTDVRPAGRARTSVLVQNGRIAAIGPSITADNVQTIDGAGALMLPGLVEAHTHLDKTLYGMTWYRNEVGPRLIDKIDNERAMRKGLGIDPARQSARQAILSVGHGTTHIR